LGYNKKDMFLMDFLKRKRDDKSISGMEEIRQILDYADKHDLYPDLKIIESAVEPEVIISGKKYLMFASNNYLGLAGNSYIKKSSN
jgi:7-keto-8-aminopelargonate synthetase-like enzyme